MKKMDFKNLSLDILIDVISGILIALGTYNFAAEADFPMVGVNGIALIFYHLFGSPIGTVALILNIPIAIFCFRILGRVFFMHSVRTIIITSLIMDYVAPLFSRLYGRSASGSSVQRHPVRTGICVHLHERFFHRRRRFHHPVRQSETSSYVYRQNHLRH